jgi:hypothetical protein
MAEERSNQSKFINKDVFIEEQVTLKKRKIKGVWKAIIESADGRVIWLEACKNGIMATSKDEFVLA